MARPPALRLCLTGASPHAAPVVACAHATDRKIIVCLATNLGAAETLAEETGLLLQILTEAKPTARAISEADVATDSFDAECDLLGALAELRHGKHDSHHPLLLACSPGALLRAAPAAQELAEREVSIAIGDKVNLQKIAERLAAIGYTSEALCEHPGEYAIRGGILDVYPLNATEPSRVDCFGDTVESVRTFDPATQRSEKESTALVILGLGNQISSGRLIDHLPADTLIVATGGTAEHPAVAEALKGGISLLAIEETDTALAGLKGEPCPITSAEDLMVGAGAADTSLTRAAVLRAAASRARDGRTVIIAVDTEGAKERASADAAEIRGFKAQICLARISAGSLVEPNQLPGPLANGLVLLTERELFARRRRTLASLPRRRTAQRSQVGHLLDFSELVEGDALVHATQGICLFRGIRTFNIEGQPQEFLSLEFADRAMLHLALRESHLLSRYVGMGRITPRLSKLGGNGWERTRKAAEHATLDLAAELLSVQAARTTRPGISHPRDEENPWMGEFERSFPHRETPDQTRAIAETKNDLERASPMDRLICGDVGFGKTEVALRAAFKCLLGGRQVAVLAPTTVLAQQLHETFRERMARWPISVELLSSYRTATQRAATRERAKAGTVDVVVGTHALLSEGTAFAKLGLVVVDEEHRFGVRHKEQLKRLRMEVDVIAMSATPIPRTLYLALVGARDLSVIETAPRERLPIRTSVRSYDENLVRDAIRAELARGGQVFYLHNRIETIEATAARIRLLVPRARISVGHGQMGSGELEAVMSDFVAGNHDVLVCTTIIETGLDIPNCNTLILEGADRLGLAQLYQIRGRVGRFNRQAYAYLFLHRHGQMAERARQRLSAVRQHNQLGAGFRIAMRDLELRGAGNLLGSEQSGHIAGVGFELYCQLLRQSISRLKGGAATGIRAEIHLDCIQHADTPLGITAESTDMPNGPILTATLPVNWIPETRLRIEAFRRIALAPDSQAVKELRADLRDRFGRIPPEADALLKLAELRCLAELHRVVRLETDGNILRCVRVKPDGVEEPIMQFGRFPRLTAKDPLRKLTEVRGFLSRLPPLGTT